MRRAVIGHIGVGSVRQRPTSFLDRRRTWVTAIFHDQRTPPSSLPVLWGSYSRRRVAADGGPCAPPPSVSALLADKKSPNDSVCNLRRCLSGNGEESYRRLTFGWRVGMCGCGKRLGSGLGGPTG